MFSIEVTTTFCAAHALRLPASGATPASTEPLHGHNFNVTVTLSCQKLDGMQVVADFHDVERLLEGILLPWNNQNLNMIEPFRSRINPSAERIAEQIGLQLQGGLSTLAGDPVVSRGLRVTMVRLTEAPNCVAVWEADRKSTRLNSSHRQ